MKEVYFPQAWAKFAENGNLDLKDAYRFVKDLMTEPVTKKDDSIKEHAEANAAKKKSSLKNMKNYDPELEEDESEGEEKDEDDEGSQA